ncbi:hypothetical protein [Sphingopyxis sp. MC1]|uniref:hypothetical protein n=1 Tax=Sphingopyxis sp. MC1 TaxID=1174684 RepID=UPI0012DBF4E1|nr:hypothetical protein [Sphingopyxis sp. MC1]
MIINFWKWLAIKGLNGKRGITPLFDRWILLHCAIAAALVAFLNIDPFKFAGKALFPAASILVGMAVAWTSRASTILHDAKFREAIISDDNPPESYFYSYQLSLLIMISTVVYISIMAAGGFSFYVIDRNISSLSSGFFLYFLLSVSIRECWSIVNFSSLLSILNDKATREQQRPPP